MQPISLVDKDLILVQLQASSKKRALELIAEKMAVSLDAIDSITLFEALIDRERLGSTGIGSGVAVPHCRIPVGQGIKTAIVTLKSPIDFDAIDSEPVDLLYVMVVFGDANQSHLDTLAEVARLYSDPMFCANLRKATSEAEVMRLFENASVT